MDLLFRSYLTQIMCAQGQFQEAKKFVEETEQKALKYYENVTQNDVFIDLHLIKATCIMNSPPASEQEQA